MRRPVRQRPSRTHAQPPTPRTGDYSRFDIEDLLGNKWANRPASKRKSDFSDNDLLWGFAVLGAAIGVGLLVIAVWGAFVGWT